MSDLQVRGALWGGTGSPAPFTSLQSGAQRVSDAHGRFMDAALQGRLFSTGMTTTAITNATFTTATLTATCTPIIGVWNPVGSGRNLVILQAKLNAVVTASTATGGGAFVWVASTGQSAITTGLTPLNRFSLTASGSIAKGFASTALTGLSGSLVVYEASALNGGVVGNFSQVGTAVGFVPGPTPATVDNVDGAIIVPPGGVLALLCTTTPVAISVASSLLWEEVPIFT